MSESIQFQPVGSCPSFSSIVLLHGKHICSLSGYLTVYEKPCV
uniref:Uncharacterized protein n=1 Tax=Arundo donax TaxID=35708 RepID=A0A0A9BZ24_ARUDO